MKTAGGLALFLLPAAFLLAEAARATETTTTPAARGAAVIPAFTNDAAADTWVREHSPAYRRMAEFVDARWGCDFGLNTNSAGGLAYVENGRGRIDLAATLTGPRRISVLIFEMMNLRQQDRHEEVTAPVRRGEQTDATLFALRREAVEYDALRLHRDVLIELERAVGELPPEMVTWASSTATNVAGYELPYAHDYFKAQAGSGHTQHYYRLFEKHRAEAARGPR